MPSEKHLHIPLKGASRDRARRLLKLGSLGHASPLQKLPQSRSITYLPVTHNLVELVSSLFSLRTQLLEVHHSSK